MKRSSIIFTKSESRISGEFPVKAMQELGIPSQLEPKTFHGDLEQHFKKITFKILRLKI